MSGVDRFVAQRAGTTVDSPLAMTCTPSIWSDPGPPGAVSHDLAGADIACRVIGAR